MVSPTPLVRNPEGPPKLALRARQAAQALGIGERLLWSMTKGGQIPCVRLGSRLILYPVDALRDWLQARTTGGQTAGPETTPPPNPVEHQTKNPPARRREKGT